MYPTAQPNPACSFVHEREFPFNICTRMATAKASCIGSMSSALLD